MVVGLVVFLGQLGLLGPAVPVSSAASAQPPPPAPTLRMSDAVARARSSSPRRRAAETIAESAGAAARATAALPNPFFDFRTENWSPSGRVGAPQVDVFAVLTQPLEMGGKRSLRRQLAVSEGEVARTSLHALEREIAIETVRAYVSALRARAVAETLTANRQGLAALIESVGRQVDEGYSPEADLLKFRTEAARVDGAIARAQLDLDRSLSAVGALIGAERPVLAAQLEEPARLAPPAGASGAIAAAVARHPGVLEANATIDRAHQAAALERARRVIDPAFTGGYKRTNGFDTAVFGVSVAVPLFDRNTVAITRSAGVERSAMAERDALMLQLSTDGAAAIRAATAIAERADSVERDLLAPAEEVRQAALAAFREGATDALQLIDAERVYADVRLAAIDLRLDALQMTIEARFALGEEAIP